MHGGCVEGVVEVGSVGIGVDCIESVVEVGFVGIGVGHMEGVVEVGFVGMGVVEFWSVWSGLRRPFLLGPIFREH